MSARYPSTPNPQDSGSTRTADLVQDFAFADTVIADDLEVVPPSGIVVSEEHQVTTLDYPLEASGPSSYDPNINPNGFPQQNTQMGGYPVGAMCPIPATWWDRVRSGMQRSREEMTLLWGATANLDEQTHAHDGTIVHEEDPFLRAAAVGRRVRTLWSFFEWDRADLVRAAWIGLAVFVLAATVGAFLLGSSQTPTSPTSGETQQQQQMDVNASNVTYTRVSQQ